MIAKCPACGKSYKLQDHLVGKPAKCTCGNKFIIQDPGEDMVEFVDDPTPAPAPPVSPTMVSQKRADHATRATAAQSEAPQATAVQDDEPIDPFRPRPRTRPVLAAAEEKPVARKIVLLSLGAVAAVFVAGIAINMLFPPEAPPGPKCDMTTKEFLDTIDWQGHIVPRYELADFKRMVGEPTRLMLAGMDAHLIYECKDGRVHIIAMKDMYTQGTLWITQLKEE